jgi:CBS domain-containing protein
MAIADILKQRAEGARVHDPSHPRIPPLTVQNILAKRPAAVCCVDSGMEVLTALRLMAQRDVASVLVMDRGKLAGIFSEREYRNAAAVEPAGSITVGEVMIPSGVTVSPEDSAHHCLGIFTGHHLRYLPVERETQLIDVLSLEELLGALTAHYQQIIMALKLDQQVMFLRGTYSC